MRIISQSPLVCRIVTKTCIQPHTYHTYSLLISSMLVTSKLQLGAFKVQMLTIKFKRHGYSLMIEKYWLNLTLWSRMQITVSCWVNSTWMCVIQSYEPFPNQYHHQQICMSLLNTNSLLNQFVSYDFAQSLLNQSLFQVFVEYLLLFWGWISIW